MARPRSVSDEDILIGVRRAVLEQGPHVSMDVVAELLGVTAPALFRRFGSRHELLTAALKPVERPPYIDSLETGPDARSVQEQLIELFTQIGAYMVEALPCMSALRESGIACDPTKDYREPPPLRAAAALSGWLIRAHDAGLLLIEDPENTATAMLGAIQAPIFFRYIAKRTDPWDPLHHARVLTRIFLQGVATLVKPTPPPTSARTSPRKLKET